MYLSSEKMILDIEYNFCVYNIKLHCPLRGATYYTELIYEDSNECTARKASANFHYEAFSRNRRWNLDNNSLWSIVEMNAKFFEREEQHGHRIHLSLPDERNESALTPTTRTSISYSLGHGKAAP